MHAATTTWIEETFGSPSAIQAAAWPRLAAGESCLLVAPTGSGKTLAAFLAALDRWLFTPTSEPGVRVVYVSPLRALAHDIEQNLLQPLDGIRAVAARLGESLPPLSVALRTGDTKPADRARFVRRPSSILITTPESLYLLLQSRAAAHLATVETVIVDELHALYPTKRGAHLLLTLERLAAIARQPLQRIGLSATAPSPAALAQYLGGDAMRVIATGERPQVELVVESIDAAVDPSHGPTPSVWRPIHDRLLELIAQHRSTIVFCNSRRLCERLAQALNDRAAELHPEAPAPLVLAHHGSLSLQRRRTSEAELKAGRLRGLVATSSLELGVDYAAVDLVVQIESPGSATRGLQRVGRAGHRRGVVSRARLFAKLPAELPELAAVTMAMRAGALEPMVAPTAPLDVLAQQLVAIAAADGGDVPIDAIWERVRRAAPYRELAREEIVKLVDLLAGHHAVLTEVRPLLSFDRAQQTIRARPAAALTVRSAPGTIPDRGLFAVRLADGTRIGELDEEMTYESRVGETFLLGASAWRILSIGVDRLVVEAAPGSVGRTPFWHGDRLGRPTAIGERMSALLASFETASPAESRRLLIEDASFSPAAADRLLALCAEQRQATGRLPSLGALIVERFADELGDLRVAVLSPFGGRVHAPWSVIAAARLEAATGVRPDVTWTEDGIAFRWSPTAATGLTPGALIFVPPDEVREIVLGELGQTPLFAARFRECAGRALLLPRRAPGQRRPLWLDRRRAQALFAQARGLPDFPITRAALQECLEEVYDVPALERLMRGVADGSIAVHEVQTARPSPMAQGLSFAYLRDLLYAGDAPAAEQRLSGLSLDEATLTALTGLAPAPLDPALVAELEAELQRTLPGRRAESTDEVFDLLRTLGPLDEAGLAARVAVPLAPALDELLAAGRIARHGARLAFVGDAALSDAARLDRFARTHGPFGVDALAAHLGVPADEATALLATQPDLVRAPFGLVDQYADPGIVRRLRRRLREASVAAVQPVSPAAHRAFVARWQQLNSGHPDLTSAIERLAGWSAPIEAWLTRILPARVASFSPIELDALCASGQLGWRGVGRGRIELAPRGELWRAPEGARATLSPEAQQILGELEARYALFASELAVRLPALGNVGLARGLWELVWAGFINNDSLAPLRAFDEKTLAAIPARGARVSPIVAGRWALLPPAPAIDDEAQALGEARRLVARWGLVDRRIVEGIEGIAWPPIRRACKLLEERGRLRFGAFVEGGLQFAPVEAVEALRSTPAPAQDAAWVLSIHDPWCALLVAGTGLDPHRTGLVLVRGQRPIAHYDPNSGALRLVDAAETSAATLYALLGRIGGTVELTTIDGERALRVPLGSRLAALGARVQPSGLSIPGG